MACPPEEAQGPSANGDFASHSSASSTFANVGGAAVVPEQSEEGRMEYANKLELMLTLVGYAVGLGNVWRFPYLAFSYGGGAFLVPYAIALALLGLPLFVLELGLGQMFRQGTLGVWAKMRLPRMQGVGITATACTFLVSLYYNVILAWTVYYIGRTLGSIGGPLPWTDKVDGVSCPETVLVVEDSVVADPYLIDAASGLFNQSFARHFWCPESGVPTSSDEAPAGYTKMFVTPTRCPAAAASQFWSAEVLQQSSGMDELGGIHPGMLLAYTIAWLLIYFCVCKGIASSGKVVYVTATMPYVALIVFFFRAVTLDNAGNGVKFFVLPDLAQLGNGIVWLRAVIQIFYSLGVGFGSLIAFASYGNRRSDFAMDAVKVSLINCGTSIFAGFVVFPILGFLAKELSEVNPCIQPDNLGSLSAVGLSGTSLAFVAFPIAISQMPGSFFWAMLFFLMLLCLGIDSQFAMCESVITVLEDAGVHKYIAEKTGKEVPKPAFAATYCFISWILGLIFVTRGGIYWFNLFDYYTCVVAMFFVTLVECVGLMWVQSETWQTFYGRVQEWTGRKLHVGFQVSWKAVCPFLLFVLIGVSLGDGDLMDAANSKRFPEGSGYLPPWSIFVGWMLGLVPVMGFPIFLFAYWHQTGWAPGFWYPNWEDPRNAEAAADGDGHVSGNDHGHGLQDKWACQTAIAAACRENQTVPDDANPEEGKAVGLDDIIVTEDAPKVGPISPDEFQNVMPVPLTNMRPEGTTSERQSRAASRAPRCHKCVGFLVCSA